MPLKPGILFAAAASAVLLAARLAPLPPLLDAATGRPAAGCRLEKPAAYVLSAPFSPLADWVTFNSARQDKALAAWLVAAYAAYFLLRRGKRRFVLFQPTTERRAQRLRAMLGFPVFLAWVCAFLAWAVLCPRPVPRLLADDPDDVVVDFHSHTAYSWDGRRAFGGFSPAKNLEWHRRAGFTAFFVTDHNIVSGARDAKALSRRRWRSDGVRALEGEELSLQGAHVAVLGNSVLVDNALYDRDLAGIFRFLREDTKYGGLSVMSLPEYWLHHPEERWEKFALGGAAGFEIVNAAPKALDFPPELRARVLELCRRRRLFAVGASDNHGWGRTTYVWNLLRVPGQARMDPDRLQQAVLSSLRRAGADAVRVVVRDRRDPSPGWRVALDAPLGLWTLCRTLSWGETAMAVLWAWLLVLAAPLLGL